MCKLKALILMLISCMILNCHKVDAISNRSQYYNQNITTPSMRHYSIVNRRNNSTIPKFTAPDITQFTEQLTEELAVEPDYAKHLQRSSVIYALTSVANESNVSTDCYMQLKYIQRGILRKEPWAMKVLDASGTKPSGFVFGQNFWLGSREACGAVQTPVAITLSKNFQRVMYEAIITERAPFDMDYRVVYLSHNSPWQVEIKVMSEQIIHIGLCLPSACASAEIERLTADYVERGMFVENDIYDIRPQVVYMKDLNLSASFYEKTTFRLLVAFGGFTGVMMLCALVLRIKANMEAEEEVAKPIAIAETLPKVEVQRELAVEISSFAKTKSFVRCFDLGNNYDKMFALKEATIKEIPVINGLRSVCAIWIMLFHVMWYMYFTVNNKAFLISYAERVFFQYVSSAPLLVDVFFTISGFLQTYNFLRNTKQMDIIRRSTFGQNVKQFFKLLFHRYLRLAPLYLVIMGVVDLFYAYIGDVSVYHINDRFDLKCSQHWWRNLLFIQNFFNHNDMCLNWTWSLACEMQYFVLATIMLFSYAKHPRLVKSLAVIVLAATIGWTYNIGLSAKFQLSFDSAFATGTDVYISPFVRILPYVMGAITGWYLMEKQTHLDMSDTKEKCFWNLAILLFFLCIYSTIKRDMSVLASISLFVIGRFLFSLSVCWMIVGSATGRGSWWSRILEAKVFQHINRVSYAIYLLNPFVIAFFFSLTSVSTHADPFMLCVITSGFAVIVYLTSVVFSLAFEMPYCQWSSQMLARSKQKSA